MMITNTRKRSVLCLLLAAIALAGCEDKKEQDDLSSDASALTTQRQATQDPNLAAYNQFMSSTKKKRGNVEIKKDEKGDYKVSWEILSEYDLTTKEVGKNLSKVVEKPVVMKGFMIPLDYAAKTVKEFLLVPYMPSCAHVPPPPANMIVNVKTNQKDGIKPSYYPVEIRGKLRLAKPTKKKQDDFMPEGVFSVLSTSIEELK